MARGVDIRSKDTELHRVLNTNYMFEAYHDVGEPRKIVKIHEVLPLELEQKWLGRVEAFVKEHNRLPSDSSDDKEERSLEGWLMKARSQYKLTKDTVDRLSKLGFIADKKLFKENKENKFREKINEYLRFVKEKGRRPSQLDKKKCKKPITPERIEEGHLADFAFRARRKFNLQQGSGEFSEDVKMCVEAGILDGITSDDLIIRDDAVKVDGLNNFELTNVSAGSRETLSTDIIKCRRIKGDQNIPVGACLENFMDARSVGGSKLCFNCKKGKKIREVYGNEDMLSKAEREKLGIID